ncbi:MAG: NAD-dependent epimerase/dehydratase family protein [Acidobacteriota bacterium]|nr:NAD-dependent epimerase/dehydratase family protein [Acidobacteriota bacterium]
MISLVTGASGFVGSHVVRLLLGRGQRVRVLLRPSSDLRAIEGLDVERIKGDLLDPGSLRAAFAGATRVYHVAADYRLWSRHPAEIYRSNVEGTRNLLEAARIASVEKLVYTSTVGTIAVPVPGGLPNEQTPARLSQMIGHYKRSKFLAEQEALEAAHKGLPVVIVNPTTPVGPGDWKPTPTGKMIVDFLNGKIPAYVETGLNIVAVEDVALGHLLAAERGGAGERYLLGGENLALKDIFQILARISGRPAPRRRIPHSMALIAAAIDTGISTLTGHPPRVPLEGARMAKHSMFVDGSKAGRELGFTPRPAEQALQAAVEWYRDNGYVKGKPPVAD